MPKSIDNIVIFMNFPCILLVVAVILLLVAARFIKPLTLVLRLFALIFWIFQVVWQIAMGTTMQELAVVWGLQLIVMWLTTQIPSKTEPLPKEKDKKENSDIVDNLSPQEDVQASEDPQKEEE